MALAKKSSSTLFTPLGRLGREEDLYLIPNESKEGEAPKGTLISQQRVKIDNSFFVALDCEFFTGSKIHLTEVGAVKFTKKGFISAFETLVNAVVNKDEWPNHSFIDYGLMMQAPSQESVSKALNKFCEDAIVIQHSVNLQDSKLAGLNAGLQFDTCRLGGRLLGLQSEQISLKTLCKVLKVRQRRSHRAIADAEATAACFIELLKLGKKRLGWEFLDELILSSSSNKVPFAAFSDLMTIDNYHYWTRQKRRRQVLPNIAKKIQPKVIDDSLEVA